MNRAQVRQRCTGTGIDLPRIAELAALWSRFARYRSIVWLIALTSLLTLFVVKSRSDFGKSIPILTQANPTWLLVAFGLQLVIVLLIASKFRYLFSLLGSDLTRSTLATSHARRHFLSTVLPFGGPAGLACFVRDLGKQGVRQSTTLYATVLACLTNQLSFALFLIPILA